MSSGLIHSVGAAGDVEDMTTTAEAFATARPDLPGDIPVSSTPEHLDCLAQGIRPVAVPNTDSTERGYLRQFRAREGS